VQKASVNSSADGRIIVLTLSSHNFACIMFGSEDAIYTRVDSGMRHGKLQFEGEKAYGVT